MKENGKSQYAYREHIVDENNMDMPESPTCENAPQGKDARQQCDNMSGRGQAGESATEKVADDATSAADRSGDASDKNASDQLGETEKSASEAAEWREKYLRLSAEFDNYRKRTLRERMELVASAGEDVMKSLLPVIDDLERAIKAMSDRCAVGQGSEMEAMLEGVVLIYNKLRDTLRSKGLHEIEAQGAMLDTDLHEAVAKVPVPKSDRGRVVDVVQKGYRLGDKVVRYAKVVVGE